MSHLALLPTEAIVHLLKDTNYPGANELTGDESPQDLLNFLVISGEEPPTSKVPTIPCGPPDSMDYEFRLDEDEEDPGE